MQKFYENQMKLINGINATIERAVEVFNSEPSTEVGGDVAEVENEVRQSARLFVGAVAADGRLHDISGHF